jgi:MoxR-like ATPase
MVTRESWRKARTVMDKTRTDAARPDVPSALSGDDAAIVARLREARRRIREEMAKVIVGQDAIIEHMLVGLLCRGHVLLLGVPGLGKTLMARTLARALELEFRRIQFTPDLMPSDITGMDIIEEDPATGHRKLEFLPGPIFTNFLLADEINRTPPKTQAALLQAMQEREVTVGQETLHLPDPFFVIATQNPIEQEGTYPLPEAQLDRFMFDIRVGYPTLEEEEKILGATTKGESADLKKMLSAKAIINLQKLVTSVPASDYTIKYVARIVRATRPSDPLAPQFIKDLVDVGAGPRAGQNLLFGAKAMAAMDGRFSVSLDDVRKVAIPVLRHRLATNFQAQAEGQTTDSLVKRLLSEIREPDIPKYEKAAR